MVLAHEEACPEGRELPTGVVEDAGGRRAVPSVVVQRRRDSLGTRLALVIRIAVVMARHDEVYLVVRLGSALTRNCEIGAGEEGEIECVLEPCRPHTRCASAPRVVARRLTVPGDAENLSSPVGEWIDSLRAASTQESRWDVEHAVGAEDEAVDVVEHVGPNPIEDLRRGSPSIQLFEAHDQRHRREPVSLARLLNDDVDESVRLVLRVECDAGQATVVEALPADAVDAVDVGPRRRVHGAVRADHAHLPLPELGVEDAAVRRGGESGCEARGRDPFGPERWQAFPRGQRLQRDDAHCSLGYALRGHRRSSGALRLWCRLRLLFGASASDAEQYGADEETEGSHERRA